MPDDLPSSRNPNRLSRWWSRLFGRYASNGMARSDIVEFLGQCRRVNLLDTDEHAMLQGVLKVSETQVRDIMVPRSHMVVLELEDPPQAMLKTIVDSGHSRFPVVGEDRDEVAGIVLAKDLLRYFGEDHPSDSFQIEDLLRKAIYIPESKRLDTLLTQFRESHNHMAIVVDEYGGVAGLATIEDVIEQIVGDIDDEHDPEEAEYIHDHGEGRFTVLALTRIEDFSERFGVDLANGEFDTVGGLVMHKLGRLPRRGEVLEFAGLRFCVKGADRRRIQSLEVTTIPAARVQ
ncbi:MAG: CBS domain-containing protein [Proteobacteria bacterium]|nr:CBS domain-containing protein [Pseudomonadota bacterium]MYJ97050.1 CBS domain-containing protein [Pseudomonadota bacterium]